MYTQYCTKYLFIKSFAALKFSETIPLRSRYLYKKTETNKYTPLSFQGQC